MKTLNYLSTFFIFLSLLSCQKNSPKLEVNSPNKSIAVHIMQSEEGQLGYNVQYNNIDILNNSFLGFDFTDAPSLKNNLKILKTTSTSHDSTWEMPWGQQTNVRNHYNELKIFLQESKEPNRKLNLV
ncbi:MAG: glycoside hydrolase family 97 N-terminal domain-containing protein, partial [Lutibacter sp.]